MSTGRVNLVLIIVFVILFFVAAGRAEGSRPVPLVICDVFGERYCADALEVAWCESRFNTDARNGQYRGLFQVSGHWRRTVVGWGPSASDQARHALRVFKKTGWDWGEWTCQP